MQLPKNSTPFIAGAVVGVVAIAILSFANGWVVTSSKMEIAMHEANVSVQAEICAAKAELFLKETNNTDELQGYQTDIRERREALARTSTTILAGDNSATQSVASACAGLLNKSRT